MSAANSQTPRETGNQQDEGTSNPYPKPLAGHISPSNREGILRIDVVVADATGKPVTDLDAKDFTLLDNGLPTPIFTLQSSTRQDGNPEPLPELIFVFNEDTLPSEQSQRAEKVVAAYLRKSRGQLAQPVSLYRVTHDGLFASARQSIDGNALGEETEMRREPRLLWPAGAKSPGWHPMDHAGPQVFRINGVLGLIATDQRNIPGRKTLLWFGDSLLVAGHWCNLNEAVELSTRLREARISVNVVLLNSRPEGNTDFRALTAAVEKDKPLQPARLPLSAIATHTGGLVVDTLDDLMSAIERCAAEAGSFYSLTFDPPPTEHPDEYHDLAVAVSRPGLTARTFAGYYNQPVYWDHPRHDLDRVTVAQLENAIRQETGESGFPRRLGNMELTERLMNEKRAQLLGLLRDDREREALMAVADLSEFLAPAPADALPDPFPGLAAETEILKRTYDYLADSIHKLPDFFATRTTVSYQEPQVRDEDSCKIRSTEQSLRVAFTARGTVLYRNGAEMVDVEKSSRKRMLKGRENALDTRGTFGPVLASVLTAAATGQSSLTWSRWEKSDQGNLAVFRFVVPSTAPIFEVTYCCLPEGDGSTVYRNMTGYHGEFMVDPTSGEIMRLAIEADLKEDRDPHAPLIRSALMVDYGAVEIGGHRYVSPVRSVSLSRGRTLKIMGGWGIPFIVYGPFETLVNDFSFNDYHKFGSESRMLTGFDEIPDTNPPKSGAAQPPAKPQ